MTAIASPSQASRRLRLAATIAAGLAAPALGLGLGNLAGLHPGDLSLLGYFPPALLIAVAAIAVPAWVVGARLRDRSTALRVIGIVGAACVLSLGVVTWHALRDRFARDHYAASTLALAGLRGDSGRVHLEVRRTTRGDSIDLLITSRGSTANAVGAANWMDVDCANQDVHVGFVLARDISHGSTSQAVFRYAGGSPQPETAGSEHHLPYCSFVIEHIGPGQDYFRRYAPMHD